MARLLGGGLFLIGVVDDLVKLRGPANGLSARSKFAAQLVVAIGRRAPLSPTGGPGRRSRVPPPLGSFALSLGWWFIPLAAVVIVASANAVNLTDGLDGLAGGCLLSATAAMTCAV